MSVSDPGEKIEWGADSEPRKNERVPSSAKHTTMLNWTRFKNIPFFSIQIIWFTALFPYFVMFTLLVRAVTLEGAGEGLLLYVTPDWSKLYTSECWIDSATQIFFAYSIGKKSYFNLINNFRCLLGTRTEPDVLNI
jgi:hypothetical protein